MAFKWIRCLISHSLKKACKYKIYIEIWFAYQTGKISTVWKLTLLVKLVCCWKESKVNQSLGRAINNIKYVWTYSLIKILTRSSGNCSAVTAASGWSWYTCNFVCNKRMTEFMRLFTKAWFGNWHFHAVEYYLPLKIMRWLCMFWHGRLIKVFH